jgi:hypothetical protein
LILLLVVGGEMGKSAQAAVPPSQADAPADSQSDEMKMTGKPRSMPMIAKVRCTDGK